MKNSYKLAVGLAVFLVLGGLLWWLKASSPLPGIAVQSKNTPSPAPVPVVTGAPKLSPPAAAAAVSSRPIASTTPGGNAASQRKFVDMSGRECRAILEEIKKQDFDSIMQAWLNAGRVDNDPTKQGSIFSLWGYAMRQRPVPPEFYEKMKAFMSDPSYTVQERGDLLGVLATAAKPEAAKLLIYEATTQSDKDMKSMAVFALRGLGDTENEANAVLLEPLWKESNDPVTMQSAALAMGKIGKASSVELLFNAALVTGGLDDERGQAAWDGLGEVNSESAIPPLVAAMEKNPPGSKANQLALDTLEQIVGEKAPQAVMKWFEGADSSAAPSATRWVANAPHDEQVAAAKASLDPSVPFRSEANRKAIRKGLDTFNANHTYEN